MKNKRMKPGIYRGILVLLYAVIVLLYFRPYSFYHFASLGQSNLEVERVFLFDNDWILQGVPYYREFFRLIEGGSLSWSWNEFLGSPFYATKAVYVIGDSFAWLAYFFYKTFVPDVTGSLFFSTALKFVVGGLGFELLTERFNHNQLITMILGICFMFSGWASIFLEQVYFLSFYVMIPFVLIGLERILEGKSPFVFLLFSALVLATNLYLTWSLCFFLLIYWFVRSGVKGIHGKNLLIKTGLTFGTFCLSFGLVMFITFPGIRVLLSTPRMSVRLNEYSFWSKTNLCAILMNFFIPVIKGRNLLYHDYWYYFFQIGIYCGTLSLLCVPQLFFQERPKREKLWYGVLLFLVLILLSTPKAGLLLNLSYSLRYTYYVEIALLILCAVALQKPFRTPVLWITALALTTGIGILVLGTSEMSLSQIGDYPEALMLGSAAVFLLLYAVALSFERKLPVLKWLVILCSGCEVFWFSSQALASYTKQRGPAAYLMYSAELNETYANLRAYDPSFYRVFLRDRYYEEAEPTPNAPMYYGIPALSGYDSLYPSSIRDFLHWAGLYPDVAWNFSITNFRFLETLGAKYTITTPASDSEITESMELIPELSTERFHVYRNQLVGGSARSVHSFEPKSVLEEMSSDSEKIEMNRITMSEHISENTVIADDLVSDWQQRYGEGEERSFDCFLDGKDVVCNLTLEKESPVQFSVPAEEGWELYVDGNRTEWNSADGGFLIAVIPAGSHQIRLSYRVVGMKEGIWISLGSLILLVLVSLGRFLYHRVFRADSREMENEEDPEGTEEGRKHVSDDETFRPEA